MFTGFPAPVRTGNVLLASMMFFVNVQEIQNWLRSRNTIEFLGIWERLNNPDFKPIEFDGFKNQARLNSFVLTPKQWIEKTNAIGIVSKAGRYGGTYAHKDIAFEFAT